MSRALHATVIAAHGRHYGVRSDDGRLLEAQVRGKRGGLACGDRVTIEITSVTQAVVTGVAPRASVLMRADRWRHKLLAANATQMLAVVATEPPFSDELLSCGLAAALAQHIAPLIVLNKTDLTDALAAARGQLAPFSAAGFPIVELAAREDASALRERLAGHLTVMVGQSGMGKSTLLNALVPDAAAATQEISRTLHSGRHTTTLARLYALDEQSALIDTPGMQEFGVLHLKRDEIELAFPELAALQGGCRFRDCLHDNEPGCAVRAAVARGAVGASRLSHYQRMRGALQARA